MPSVCFFKPDYAKNPDAHIDNPYFNELAKIRGRANPFAVRLGGLWQSDKNEALAALRLMKVMNGLRIFTRPANGPIEDNVFYSQRSHGPMYRWHYEKHLARWHVVRVDAINWGSHELCTTSWHSVPQELKAQLSEHYIE